MIRGDSIALELTFDDGGDPPAPINIAGRTLFFTVKRDYNDADADALATGSATFPDGPDSAAGIGYLFVPHTETRDLIPGETVWCDFQETYTNSRGNLIVNTLAVFQKTVGPDVTDRVAPP